MSRDGLKMMMHEENTHPTYLDGMIHAWDFEITSGTTMPDKVGSLEMNFVAPLYSQSGEVNNSIGFNGTSSRMNPKGTTNMDLNGYGQTFKIWYYTDNGLDANFIAGFLSASTTWCGISLGKVGNKIRVLYGQGTSSSATGYKTFESAADCFLVGWNCIFVTPIDFNNVQVRFNDVEQTMVYTVGTGTSTNFTGGYTFMNRSTGYYAGRLDEFQIWNRKLTTEEQQKIYALENAGTSILP